MTGPQIDYIMTKRQLIDELERSGVPDDAEVKIDVSLYDEEEQLKDAVAIDEVTILSDVIWIVASDERYHQ